MAAKITEVADKWIEPDQYQGSVGDGVYRHCSVPQKLDQHYSIQSTVNPKPEELES